MIPQGQSPLLPCKSTNGIPGALYVKLSQDSLDAILKSGGKGIQLNLGDAITLKIGDRSFNASSIPEASHLDVYERTSEGSSSYSHIGTITGRMTVKASTGGTAANRLKNQNSALLKEKEANKATLLSPSAVSASKPIRRPGSAAASHRKTSPLGLLNGLGVSTGQPPRSMPASPTAYEMAASTTGTSASSTTNSSTAKRQNLALLPLLSGTMRVLHLLALGSNSPRNIATRTNLSISEVDSILSVYAKPDPSITGNMVLADSTYKDLRIWEWNHYSNVDRKKVIADATAAFDRLKYPPNHPARKALEKPVSAGLSASSSTVSSPALPNNIASPPSSSAAISAATTTKSGKSNNSSVSTSSPAASSADVVRSPSSASSSKKLTKSKQPATTGSGSLSSPLSSGQATIPTPSSLPARPKEPDTNIDESATNNNANRNTSGPSSPVNRSTTSPSRATPVSNPSTVSGAKRKATSAASNGSSAPTAKARKTESTGSVVDSKKTNRQPQQEPTEELFELAQKFKDTYSEYEKLYKTVAKRQRRPRAEVQRLLNMHRELASWKQKLWANANVVERQGEAA